MKFEFSSKEYQDRKDKEGKTIPAKNKKMKCLFPRCKKQENSRGLCRGHYGAALRAVKAKVTTWKRLEREGKSKKAKLPFNHDNNTFQYNWFATKDKDYFKPEEGDVRIDSKKYVFRSFGMKRTEKETIDRIITCLVELRSLTDSFVDLDSNHQEKEIDV